MPRISFRCTYVTDKQLAKIVEILSETKAVNQLVVYPNVSKEDIEGLGWEYAKTDDLGKMYFEYGVYNLVLETDGTVVIDEGCMTILFNHKVGSKDNLKRAMIILDILHSGLKNKEKLKN